MNARERNDLKKKLLRLKDELLEKLPARIDPNRVDEQQIGGDEDEQPLNEMLQSIASGRNRNDKVTLGLVEHALQKLADDPDSFGECEDCGDEVGLPRLKALPYARFCVDCQAKLAGPKGSATRRKLTDYR